MPTPRARYRWKVTGSGSFPEDMLRYDRCHAVTANVLLGMSGDKVATAWERRTVTVEGPDKPTVGRWASFMWSVSDVAKIGFQVET